MRNLSFVSLSDQYVTKPSTKRIAWLDDFARKEIEKEKKAQSSSNFSDKENSLINQINSVLYPSQKPTTLAGLIQDLQERAGLKEYMKIVSTKENAQVKSASEVIPECLKKLPPDIQQTVMNFIVNKVKTYHGNVSIPAIQLDVLNIFRHQGVSAQDIESAEMAAWINQIIIDEQKNSPSRNDVNNSIGLGVGTANDGKHEGDGQNSDAFINLMPSKG